MRTKKILQVILIIAVLISSLASTNIARAWYTCANYVTVQWGDTLSGIAATCGTTVEAIRAANPGLGWWVYAGQVLYIPTGYTSAPVYYPTHNSTYIVQWGDTLAKIASKAGVSMADILAVNPQIWNANWIYAGQVIYLPTTASISYPLPASDPVHYPLPTQPASPSGYATLKISYINGLFIRCDPGGDVIGWATYEEYKKWQYIPSSVFRDAKGKVWVQVVLDPPQSGYAVGWILVKDQLGTYFTDPKID